MKLNLRVWFRRFAAALLCLMAIGISVQRWHDSRSIQPFPMPGELVDLGTHRLHSHLMGDVGPLVILESGLGGESYTWLPIQRELSTIARVLVYDRAGYGWSDVGPSPRSNLQAVEELRLLLHKRELKPPYLLVGHSMGGLNARLFASMYPQEVAGLVLIDAYNRDLFDASTDVGEMSALFRFGHTFRHFGLPQIIVPGLVREALANATDEISGFESQMIAFKSRSQFVDTYIKEDLEPDWLAARAQMQQLGDLPVTVITADKPIERYRSWWPEAQLALQQSVANSPRIIQAPCGHAVHLECPDLVVGAVEEHVKSLASMREASRGSDAASAPSSVED